MRTLYPLRSLSTVVHSGAARVSRSHGTTCPFRCSLVSRPRVTSRPTQQLAHRSMIAIVYLSTSRAPHEGQTAERDLALPFAASAGGALFEDEHNHHEAA